MEIDEANSAPCEVVAIDEGDRLAIGRHFGLGKAAKTAKNEVTLGQVAQRQLAEDKWVPQNPPRLEQVRQRSNAAPEMVDPNRRVDEDHDAERRRLVGFRSGAIPPSRA